MGKYDIDDSPYAEVHGHADWYAQSEKTDVHVHCLGYAHSNRRGNYTLLAMVAEAEGEDWGRENYPDDDYYQGSFEGGCYVLAEVTFNASDNDVFHTDVIWSASATVEDETEDDIARDYLDHKSE